MCNSVIFTVQRYEEIAHELKPYVFGGFFLAIFAKLSGRWFEKIFVVVVRQ